MVRRIVLQFCWVSVLAAQGQQGITDRPVKGNSPGAAIADQVLKFLGPADPKELTPRERFDQYILNMVGPAPIFGEAVGSALNQWSNTPGEWGQGWSAYGKRYASNFG